MKKLLVIFLLVTILSFRAETVSAASPQATIFKPVCVRPVSSLSAKCWANVKKGEKVWLTGKIENNFYKVFYKGHVGWIYRTKLTIAD